MDIVSVSHTGQVLLPVRDAASPNWLKENQTLVKSVQGINKSQLLGPESEMTLAIDQQTRRPVVRIVSRETHQVVMQLPEEYVLQLQQALQSHPDSYQKADLTAADQEGSAQLVGC